MSQRAVRIATGVAITGALALLAVRVLRVLDDGSAPIEVDLAFTTEPEQPWRGTDDLVEDLHAGHRARRAHVHVVGPGVERRTDDHGLLRADDLGPTIAGPRILLLGDDQTMGAVATADNLSSATESSLRAAGWPTATLLNAATDHYGLLHYALRAPELIARYDPAVLVICIDLGTDLIALIDPSGVHHRPGFGAARATVDPDADPLGLRRLALEHALPADDRFARSTGPALWLHANPAAAQQILDAAFECLRDLQRMRPSEHLLLVLLPAVDEVAPRSDAHDEAAADLAAGLAAARTIVTTVVDRLHLATLDVRQPSGEFDAAAFTANGLLSAKGHRIVAARLASRLLMRLDAR